MGQTLSARLSGLAQDVLIEHALCLSSEEIVAETDRPTLAVFTRDIVTDLLGELEKALGLEEAAQDRDPYAVIVVRDEKNRDLMSLRLSAQACRALVRAAFGESRAEVRLRHRADALESEPLQIEARAGAAVLGLEALSTLAVGDVIVLDRAVDRGVELAIRGGRSIALAELAIGEGQAEAMVINRV